MPQESRTRSRRVFLLVQGITLLRVPLAALFAIVTLAFDRSTATVVLGTLLVAAVEGTDLLDGFLARKLKSTTEWGAMIDPYADSISRLTVYWALAVSGLVLPIVPLVMALRDVSVSYARCNLVRHGLSVGARLSGKIKAIFQGGGAFWLALGPLYWAHVGTWPLPVISWLVVTATLVSLIDYGRAGYQAGRGR